MAFQIGGRELPDPTQQMEAGPVLGVGVHRRAYAKLEISDQTQFVTCGSNYSIESSVKGTHASMFSDETSTGRIAPKPSLDSITVSNDGGQDMSDAMLFQADITLKVYNEDDFNKVDTAFMTPRRKVKITIGYVGGSKYELEAEITGFNFTINSDLSYDVTIKAAGAQDGLIEADYTTLRENGPAAESYTDEESGKKVESPDVITNFLARMARVTNDTSGFGTDGEAMYDSGEKILVINHQMEEGFFNNDNIVSYVSLQNIIEDINKNAGTVDGIPQTLFDSSQLKYTYDTNIAAGNPLELIFGWQAKYGDTDYNLTQLNQGGLLEKIWVSQTLLQSIYDQLKKPPGKDDTPQRVSTSTLLKKVFSVIESNSGGHIKLFLYADPDVCDDGRFLILNRGMAAKKTTSRTEISVANGYEKGVRDISLTSNLDSELIALATAAAMDGEGGEHLGIVFPGCYDNSKTSSNPAGKSLSDLLEDMKAAREAIGDKISESETSQLISATKAYVKFNDKKVNPVIPYGLECELTCDGYGGPKYGDAFTVDRLPARLKSSNIYFAVTKIGQNFSGGDWTTNITGLMMIGA